MDEPPDLSSLCRLCGSQSSDPNDPLDYRLDEVSEKLQILQFKLSEDEGLPTRICSCCASKLTEIYNFVSCMQRTEEYLKSTLASTKQIKALSDMDDSSLNFLDSEGTSLCLEVKSETGLDISWDSQVEMPIESSDKSKKRKSSTLSPDKSKKSKRESICEKLVEMASKMKETEEINATLNLQASTSTAPVQESQSILEMITKNQVKPRPRIQLDSSKTTICICNECNIMFSSGELLQQHLIKHFVFQCHICGAKFNTGLILAGHLKRNVHKIAFRDTKWTCGECFLVCKDKGSMLEHVRSVHTKERPFECNLCDRKFAVKRALTLHVREHKQDWSHVCTFCGKGFLIKEYHEIHIRRYHTNEKPFECDRCDAKYPSKLQLSEHIIAKHEGGRPEHIFTCQFCNKKFKGSTGFKYHVRTHEMSLDERKKFKCNDCDASFIRKPALIKHMKRHKGEYEEFECNLCGKKLATSHGLELHLVVHSGEKNHICEFCGKAFAAAGTLKVHIRSHTGEKPYQCKFCPKKFTQRSSIKVHMKNLHQYDDTDRTNLYTIH